MTDLVIECVRAKQQPGIRSCMFSRRQSSCIMNELLIFFLLCGATMEAASGMLIHSTALRPLTVWPSAHPQCVCNVCRCCATTVIMTGRVCESLVPYI